ncbi:MAG: type II toxin-antitoxin system RelE/ParE family toxin [Chloroflexi bacterium]|nr:type II toxin-antitoxin system RelE/ParE family toxin [Chloroflexota bacterium]
MVRMMRKRPFELVYAPLVKHHLGVIDRKYYALIREVIETQLGVEPDVETRNRKPLKRPSIFGATWEIRFGPGNRFRVFYRVDRRDDRVYVLAVAEKKRERLVIGGEEIEI